MPNLLNIPDEFLKRYAAALRMEPDSRTTDLANGIAARIADPLWFLTRQWQISEFKGEDAGSPIDANLLYGMRSLKSVKLRDDEGVNISYADSQVSDSKPLEMLIEQEWLKIDWKVSAQIGREFEKQIYALIANEQDAADYVQSYRAAFCFKFKNDVQKSAADEKTRRFVDFMEGRVVNGRDIINGLNFTDNSLTLLADNMTKILPAETLASIGSHLAGWCRAMNIRKVPERSKAWRNERLDYRFDLDDGNDDTVQEKPLVAPEYRSGELDWYTFDSYPELHNDGKWSEYSRGNLLPAPINITGISRRWWEFEDANIDFGHIEMGKVDIARGILMQYALVYGDDWYSLPLPVPVSQLVKITSLEVSNVFKEKISIEPAYHYAHQHIIDHGGDPVDPMQRWRIFTLSSADRSSTFADTERPVLYIPPVLSLRQESDSLEEARFVRDEWSNMVWCIEHTVLNGVGRPVDGYKAQLEYFESLRERKIEELLERIDGLESAISDLNPDDPQYSAKQKQLELAVLELKELSPEKSESHSLLPYFRLATSVPENWIPFKPFNAGNVFGGERNIRLRRAQMLRNTFNDDPEPIQAKTRLLEISGSPLLWLEENVIPRSGLRICLINQRTRWMDGQTFVWKGRKILTGRGEGHSGLIFDKVFGL